MTVNSSTAGRRHFDDCDGKTLGGLIAFVGIGNFHFADGNFGFWLCRQNQKKTRKRESLPTLSASRRRCFLNDK
jgi:hypothetical protein